MNTRTSAILTIVAAVLLAHGPSASTQTPGTIAHYVITDLGTLGGTESLASANRPMVSG